MSRGDEIDDRDDAEERVPSESLEPRRSVFRGRDGFDDDLGPSAAAVPTSRFTLPGAMMIATGVVNLVLGVCGGIIGLTFLSIPDSQIQQAIEQQSPAQREALKQQGIGVQELRNIYVYGGVGGGAIALVCSLFTILGGVCMCARKARGFALFTAILTTVPCVNSPCCLLGMPVGIWSLVALAGSDAKAAYR